MSSTIKRGSIIQLPWSWSGYRVCEEWVKKQECPVVTAKVSAKKKGGWLRARYLTPPNLAGQVFSVQNTKHVVNITPCEITPIGKVKVSDKFDDAHRTWVFETVSEKQYRHVYKTITAVFQPDVMVELSIIWNDIDEEEQKKWNGNAIEWAHWLCYGV